MDLLHLTAAELGRKIKNREVSVAEAVKAVLAQAKEMEPEINSYVTLDEAGALMQAEAVQKRIDSGELTGPLAGVPAAVKDNMCIEGKLTTCSSKILSNFHPAFTAEAVKNLQKAGAVIVGKTNMDEFAMGSTTETSYFGVTRNPWIQIMFPAALPEAPAQPWQRRNAPLHLALTQAAPSDSQLLSAVWWD